MRRKIDEEFGNTLSVKDKRSLATLIYYPQEKLELVCQEEEDQEVLEDWFKITIHRLVQMTKRVSSKYTRSKVRKALPHDFSYVIEELITEKEEIQDKELYYNEIINTIIRIGRAPWLSALPPILFNAVAIGAEWCYAATGSINVAFWVFAGQIALGQLLPCLLGVWLVTLLERRGLQTIIEGK